MIPQAFRKNDQSRAVWAMHRLQVGYSRLGAICLQAMSHTQLERGSPQPLRSGH